MSLYSCFSNKSLSSDSIRDSSSILPYAESRNSYYEKNDLIQDKTHLNDSELVIIENSNKSRIICDIQGGKIKNTDA